jgi:hypothetical protein
MNDTKAVREDMLWRIAKERGLLLVKAPTHNKQAQFYGLYVLVVDSAGNRFPGAQAVWRAFHDGEGMTLDEVAEELSR